MSAPFAEISSVNATNDVTELLVYMNTVTDGYFMPMVLLAFFIILCLGSFFMQMRFTGRGRFELSFTVAAFATFGFAVIMSTKNGLINPSYLIISLVAAVLGVAWLYLSSD